MSPNAAPVKSVIKITEGPNLGMLMDALKYAFDKRANLDVYFRIEVNGQAKGSRRAQVIGLEYDSGTPGKLIVKMNLFYANLGTVKAYYDVSTRKGQLVH